MENHCFSIEKNLFCKKKNNKIGFFLTEKSISKNKFEEISCLKSLMKNFRSNLSLIENPF